MIEIFMPELDPQYDQTLAEIAKACSALPEIPADVFAGSLEDALQGNTVRAKRDLFKWADRAAIIRRRKTYAPLLWRLHEDGFRHIGMTDADRSLRLIEVLGEYPRTCAHYDNTVILTFWDTHRWTNDARVSWAWYAAFPHADPYLFADVYRRGKQPATCCRECGCTQDDACVTVEGTCAWVEGDLCSACHAPATRVRGPMRDARPAGSPA